MTRDPEYLLGMEPAEVQRLEQQHQTWRSLTERVWALAGFGAGQSLVDLGSGPGFTSLDLARLVGPSGRVVAVDSSTIATDQLRSAIRRAGIANVEVVLADVTRFDPSPWKPDGIFARWLFCFLPDPDTVLHGVASRLTAGATVAVMDYWNYFAIRTEPSTPLFRRVFQAVYDSFADAGGSLDVAGRLPALLEKAGLRVTHVEPLCQVGRPGSEPWRWVAAFQEIYLPTLVTKGYLTAAEIEEYMAWWQEQAGNENTLLFGPPLLGVIGVKAG
jgi:SAM-dependent methyltransferase